MYGYFNLIIKSFIRQHFGEDKWQDIIKRSACLSDYEDKKVYNDEPTFRLIKAAGEVLGFNRDALLVLMGEHYLVHVQKAGHGELLRNLGANMLAFLENLDYVHTYMMSEYPDVNMPSFRCEPDSQTDKMTLHYYSFHTGLYALVMGILKAVAKDYFNSNLSIDVISVTSEEVTDQGGKREHVVFSLTVVTRPKEINPQNMAPPTMVAQTKKAGEKQILKTDIQRVMERLEQIKQEHGEAGLPLAKGRGVRAKWRSIAKMSILFGGFVPQYPPTLSISTKVFCNAFPFHVVFNSSMTVVHSGVRMQQLLPPIRNLGARLDAFFELLHPHSVTFTFENVQRFVNTPFVISTRPSKMVNNWGKRPMVIFRGQMVPAEGQDLMIYLCSPFVRCLQDLEDRRMRLADIPIHDVTRDLLWMELMARYRRTGVQVTPTTTSTSNVAPTPQTANIQGIPRGVKVGAILASTPASLDAYAAEDREGLRHHLRHSQSALEEERRRTNWVYQGFLPPTTANQIMNGEQPDAGFYEPVSILFCDVVSFSQIIAHCSPNDVVNLLTQLHTRFNRVCRVHGTYRVEVIGDAYMVVAGVPDPVLSHAERVANTALGLLIAARDVPSPYDYRDGSQCVKIRIGVHSGSVTCGVIGDRLPRFTVLGEDVSLASRMESHGLPDKIHISDVTHDCLKNKGFTFKRRGKIDVRGKGKMVTHFLLSNNHVTDDDIMGRQPARENGLEVTFINEGKEERPPRSSSTSGSRSPLLPNNRIRPSGGGDNTSVGSRPVSHESNFLPMTYNDEQRHLLTVPKK